MMSAAGIQYEVADRNTATCYGGIGLIHSLAQQCGLVEAINSNLQLLQNHFPYHESDHVLNIAYNAMTDGTCLEDLKRKRADEAYLNALGGKGVHVVTVNDYLVKRDSEWMGKVFTALGLTSGMIWSGMGPENKLAAYGCDITYGTNNEFGFDYLRDNMKSELSEVFQKHHNFAIVDEVDSILIDEARTPLIISGPAEDRSELYNAIDVVIPLLKDEHYDLDEKTRGVTFTDDGNDFLEQQLLARGLLEDGRSLYDPESTSVVHHVNQGLRAHKLFQKDKDYILSDDGEVVLIDEFTGRKIGRASCRERV